MLSGWVGTRQKGGGQDLFSTRKLQKREREKGPAHNFELKDLSKTPRARHGAWEWEKVKGESGGKSR